MIIVTAPRVCIAGINSSTMKIGLPEEAGLPAGLFISATVYAAENVDPRAPVIFLLPGAGYTGDYFNLQFAEHAGYSQVRHHVAAGLIAITMDHLGTGASTLAPDQYLMAPLGEAMGTRPDIPDYGLPLVAAGCSAAARAILQALCCGELVAGLSPIRPRAVVGVGQSMGGHVVMMAQALCGLFDGVGALGTSFTQTRLVPRPGLRPPIRNTSPKGLIEAAQANSDLAATFHWPDEPADIVASDMTLAPLAPWRTLAIPRFAASLLLPGVLAREAASVRTPVFLAFGEIDVTADPLADAAMFRSSCDVSLSILPRMAHMHNFAPTRMQLWRRLERFVSRLGDDEDLIGDWRSA